MSEDRAWHELFGGGQSNVPTPAAASALSRLRHEMFGTSPMPSQLGHLTVLERLGHGGMGVVYGAYDPQLDRRVAVKVLHLSNERAMKRALREGRALARVSHPNVVVVHGVDLVDDRVHIIMEYAPGGTLKRWLKQEHSWRAIVEQFVDAGRGLAAAHAAGLVHGDFKPDNVLLGPGGERPRVADFGLAVGEQDLYETADLGRSTSGTATRGGGTAGYASPEQAGLRTLDARSDQFSFCVALYEALHGVRPFSAEQIFLRKLETPRAGKPVGPAAVHGPVLRGLLLDPEDRFASMDELLTQLQATLRPRTRRWGLAVVGLLGVGLGVGGMLSRQPTVDCDAEPSALRSSWDATRPGVLAAIEATKLPSADGSGQHAAQFADDYVGRWGEAWHRTCSEATPEATPETALRQACLQRARQSFEALTGAMQTLRRDELPFVRAALLSLKDTERCLSRSSGGVRQPAPEDQAEVARARALLDRSVAAATLSRFEESRTTADRVVSIASSLDDGVLGSDAVLERARAEENLGLLGEAKLSYIEAVWTAFRVGNYDTVARASYRLAHIRGFQESAVEEAKWWLRFGEEACAATEVKDTMLADMRRVRAVLSFRSGHLTEADVQLREALAMYREAVGARAPTVGSLLQTIGSFTYAGGRYDAALPIFDEAISIFDETIGLGHPAALPAQVERAELLRRLGRRDEAASDLQRSIDSVSAEFGVDYPILVDHYAVLTGILIELGRMEDALPPARRAIAMRKLAGVESIFTTYDYSNLALILESLGDMDGAEKSVREALAVGRRLGSAAGFGVAVPAMALAELLERRGDDDEIPELAAVVMDALADVGELEPEMVLSMRTRAAGAARRHGRPQDTLAWMEAAAANPTFADRSPLGRLKVHREIADAHRELGQLELARPAIATAQDIAQSPEITARAQASVNVVEAEILRATGQDAARMRALVKKSRELYADVTDWSAGFAKRAAALNPD